MNREIKDKIKELKDKHFNASNRNWISTTNGLSQREVLGKLQSQVDILEELLKEGESKCKPKCERKYFQLIQSYPGSCEIGTRVVVIGTIVNFCGIAFSMVVIPKLCELSDDRYWEEFRWDDKTRGW